jgi:putative zinc finger/helix-turn-helix YgiT family protein
MQEEFCFNCDYEEELLPIRELAIHIVRGEEIEVTKEYYKCPMCGESFINSRGHDMFNEAYRKYRQRHGMLQPEEIRQWRKQYGLTQNELGMLLGWEEKTINRYENGSLQKKSEDRLLKSIMQPSNFLQLISKKLDAIAPKKRAKIIEHGTEQGLQLGC